MMCKKWYVCKERQLVYYDKYNNLKPIKIQGEVNRLRREIEYKKKRLKDLKECKK